MHTSTLLKSVQCAALILACVFIQSCATSGKLSSGNEEKIRGRTYVVTGASSGFGRGVSVKLGSYGANVVLAARRTEVLEEVAREVEAAGGKALVVTTDVSNPEDVANLARSAVARFGKVDVWINNAGVGGIGRFWDIPVADHSRIIDVNLKGVIYGSHEALRIFTRQGYGMLINLGSVESEVPLAYHASYASTKAAIWGLDKALRQELRLNGYGGKIRITTIMPWAEDTPFWTHAANYSGGTARMAAMDGPEKAVNAIVWASVHKRKKLPVGWKARASYRSARILPGFTERMSANVVHRYQMETAPPYPDTAGSVHQPMKAGTGVDGGVRARMKEEKKARKAAKK